MFSTVKLYAAGALLVVIAGAVGYHLIKVRTLERTIAQQQVVIVNAGRDLETARANHAGCERALEELRGAVDSFSLKADELSASLEVTEEYLLKARREAAALRQELARPLPERCEDAVREMANRVVILFTFSGGDHEGTERSP